MRRRLAQHDPALLAGCALTAAAAQKRGDSREERTGQGIHPGEAADYFAASGQITCGFFPVRHVAVVRLSGKCARPASPALHLAAARPQCPPLLPPGCPVSRPRRMTTACRDRQAPILLDAPWAPCLATSFWREEGRARTTRARSSRDATDATNVGAKQA